MPYKDKEKRKAHQKEYYQEHKKEIRKYQKGYYQKIKEEGYMKKWNKKNKGKVARHKKNYRNSINGIYTYLKASAKERGISFNLNKNDFVKWYKEQIKKCVYCNIPETKIKTDIFKMNTTNKLTIDRKINDGSYNIKNIALCCNRCNNVKNKLFTYNQMLIIGKMIEENRKIKTNLCLNEFQK